MTPGDVKSIRRALGQEIGRPVSQSDLGRMLGLAEANSRKTIERWETDGPTGPGGVALGYLGQGALDGVMKSVIPEHVFGGGVGEGGAGQEIVVRLWWPRFVGVVVPAEVPIDLLGDCERAWIAEGVEMLVVPLWIDDPDVPGAPDRSHWVRRAAVLVEQETLDSIEDG